jgi:hypothetical protein
MNTDKMGEEVRFLDITRDQKNTKPRGDMDILVFSSVFIRVHLWFEFFSSLVKPPCGCGEGSFSSPRTSSGRKLGLPK